METKVKETKPSRKDQRKQRNQIPNGKISPPVNQAGALTQSMAKDVHRGKINRVRRKGWRTRRGGGGSPRRLPALGAARRRAHLPRLRREDAPLPRRPGHHARHCCFEMPRPLCCEAEAVLLGTGARRPTQRRSRSTWSGGRDGRGRELGRRRWRPGAGAGARRQRLWRWGLG